MKRQEENATAETTAAQTCGLPTHHDRVSIPLAVLVATGGL